eukprot:TRINITY_DN4951_c0_g1_i4.p1 TRINITY_DN4951_c0_g1~~TRINITY_DN4951_c0_g1_i4.p1  ORF type:complete len:119 (-),score=8.06 TRINITY_DN4951_c0_g1_i4:233-589(-)
MRCSSCPPRTCKHAHTTNVDITDVIARPGPSKLTIKPFICFSGNVCGICKLSCNAYAHGHDGHDDDDDNTIVCKWALCISETSAILGNDSGIFHNTNVCTRAICISKTWAFFGRNPGK